MPPVVKKWGSIAILTTIFSGVGATLISALVVWNFSQATDVKPLVKAVDTIATKMDKMTEDNLAGHSALASMMHEQDLKLESFTQRVMYIEERCNKYGDELEKCKEHVYSYPNGN